MLRNSKELKPKNGTISEKTLKNILNSTELLIAILQYKEIEKEYKKPNHLQNNIRFRRFFEDLYTLRAKTKTEKNSFFEVFNNLRECSKNNSITYECLELNGIKGVYASKILHTMYPKKYSIIDGLVTAYFGKTPQTGYNNWNELFKKFVKTDKNAKLIIKKWNKNKKINKYGISDIKKVDFVLWIYMKHYN